MERRRWRSGILGPTILILLGILFVLANVGLMSWSVWEGTLRLWPILLTAVGMDLLLGGRSALASTLVVLVLVGIAGLVVWLAVPWPAAAWVADGGSMTRKELSRPLEGATRGDVEIGFGVGTLRVGALSQSDQLIEGVVAVGEGEGVASDYQVRGDTLYYRLHTQNEHAWPIVFGRRRSDERVWQLGLNDDVPLRLMIRTGVGHSEINLARTRVNRLDIDGGVGRTTLTLPAQGQVQAQVDGGVGEVSILIPEGMAARIRATLGLGEVKVAGNLQRQGNVCVSPGYAMAEDRVDLDVNGGMGKITVQEYR